MYNARWQYLWQITLIKFKYSKICLKRPLKKKTKIGFQDQLSLNAGQKFCRMLQREHSAIRSTFFKLPSVIKIFVLTIFEWPLKTGSTVYQLLLTWDQILQHISSYRKLVSKYYLTESNFLSMDMFSVL